MMHGLKCLHPVIRSWQAFTKQRVNKLQVGWKALIDCGWLQSKRHYMGDLFYLRIKCPLVPRSQQGASQLPMVQLIIGDPEQLS